MYHYDAKIALEELQEDALLPHPVKLRDMILRTKLGPKEAQVLNHEFQEYLTRFGELQKLVYEAGHVLHFFVNGFDVLLVGGFGALLQDSERHSSARDRSAQFMGDIAEEAPLAGHESAELRCHALNRVA